MGTTAFRPATEIEIALLRRFCVNVYGPNGFGPEWTPRKFWDGTTIGLDAAGTVLVQVPALGEFLVRELPTPKPLVLPEPTQFTVREYKS